MSEQALSLCQVLGVVGMQVEDELGRIGREVASSPVELDKSMISGALDPSNRRRGTMSCARIVSPASCRRAVLEMTEVLADLRQVTVSA
ncbi:hypothetical protein GCM10023146_02160 [Nocardioides caricicola]